MKLRHQIVECLTSFLALLDRRRNARRGYGRFHHAYGELLVTMYRVGDLQGIALPRIDPDVWESLSDLHQQLLADHAPAVYRNWKLDEHSDYPPLKTPLKRMPPAADESPVTE